MDDRVDAHPRSGDHVGIETCEQELRVEGVRALCVGHPASLLKRGRHRAASHSVSRFTQSGSPSGTTKMSSMTASTSPVLNPDMWTSGGM